MSHEGVRKRSNCWLLVGLNEIIASTPGLVSSNEMRLLICCWCWGNFENILYELNLRSNVKPGIEWGDLMLPGKNASFVFDR